MSRERPVHPGGLAPDDADGSTLVAETANPGPSQQSFRFPSSSSEDFENASPRGLGQILRAVRPAGPRSSGPVTGGTVLAGGRIRVGSRIGSGGSGTAYLATDGGRTIALKILNRLQPAQVYRLKTEFRRLAQLVHPNIICVYELFSEDDVWFFSMEHVRGLTLHRHFERLRTVEFIEKGTYGRELRACLRQLVDGIAAIHRAGLVHRDLKPTNIIVRDDGRLVILDFGLVSEQFAGGVGQTVDDRVSGTFGYMAPEQLSGTPASVATDWYAVGAILFELLTAQPLRSALLRQGLGDVPGCEWEPQAPGLIAGECELWELCQRLLATEPSARPDTEEMLILTRSLCPDSSRGSTQNESAVCAVEQFVGRDAELETLRDAGERARPGAPSVVLLHGECGMGKTAILHQFATRMRAEGAVVLESRCSEWESVPYKGFDCVVDNLSRLLLQMPPEGATKLVPRHLSAVTRLFPVLLRVDGFRDAAVQNAEGFDDEWAARHRAFSGTKDMFYRLSEHHRVVVLMDDVQWADSDSVHLLGELLSAPEAPGVLFVATFRDEDALPRELAELMRGISYIDVPLGPLSLEASVELGRALVGEEFAARQDLVERVVGESGGVPLYVAELAQELGMAKPADTAPSLSDLLKLRIERLLDGARTLLELTAIAVRPMTLAVAAACQIPDLDSSLRHLLAQRLVRSVVLGDVEHGFEPYTAHVRRVLVGAMPEARITACHTVLARVLERQSGVEPPWLLAHYRGAGYYAEARQYALIAAERALDVFAFEHAASMYLTAIDYTREHEPEWVTINLRCAEALARAGRGAEAARAYMRAARVSPPERQLKLKSRAIAQWIRTGHLDEGVTLLREMLEATGIAWPENVLDILLLLVSSRARVHLRSLNVSPRPESEVPPKLLQKLDALYPAYTALGTFDYLRGAAFSALTLPLSLKAREPKRLVLALASESVYGVMLDGISGESRAAEIHRRIDELCRENIGPYERAVARMARAMCLYWSGRWKEVPSLASQAEGTMRRQVAGSSWEVTLIRSVRHTVFVHSGRLPELAEELPEELARAVSRDDHYTHLDLLRRSVTVHLMRDERSEAKAALERLTECRARYPFLALDHLIMSMVVGYWLYEGHPVRARAELDTRWASCRRRGMGRLPLIRLSVVGMQADCILTDVGSPVDRRARLLRALAKQARSEKIAWAKGVSHELSAVASALSGDKKGAVDELRVAIDLFDGHRLSAIAAAARRRLADLLGPDDGAAPLRESEGFFVAASIARPDRWINLIHTLY